MKKHHSTGFRGEAVAINWLSRNGFMILHTNWRCARYELDIIAEKSDKLHFIEVKTRTGIRFGYPEEGVTPAKLRKMKSAGAAYLHRNGERNRVQYDIVSILWMKGRGPEIRLFEDIG
ncbi:MAG: YraN family protein [Bacteroidota bacterium]|jgi:putative endonuclease